MGRSIANSIYDAGIRAPDEWARHQDAADYDRFRADAYANPVAPGSKPDPRMAKAYGDWAQREQTAADAAKYRGWESGASLVPFGRPVLHAATGRFNIDRDVPEATADATMLAAFGAFGDVAATPKTTWNGLTITPSGQRIMPNYSDLIGYDGDGWSGADQSVSSGGTQEWPPTSIYMPNSPLKQRNVGGVDIPLPDSNAQGGPHTTLGYRDSQETGTRYRQSATFPGGPTWPAADGNEVPFSRVDWSDHGRPDRHPDPHQHRFDYDPGQRQWRIQKGKDGGEDREPFWGH